MFENPRSNISYFWPQQSQQTPRKILVGSQFLRNSRRKLNRKTHNHCNFNRNFWEFPQQIQSLLAAIITTNLEILEGLDSWFAEGCLASGCYRAAWVRMGIDWSLQRPIFLGKNRGNGRRRQFFFSHEEEPWLTSTRWLSGPYRSLSSSMTRLLKNDENFLFCFPGYGLKRDKDGKTSHAKLYTNLNLYK